MEPPKARTVRFRNRKSFLNIPLPKQRNTAFLRSDRYLNINYTTPLSEFDRDEPPEFPRENHYKTFMIQNQVTQIDKGRGVYYASING